MRTYTGFGGRCASWVKGGSWRLVTAFMAGTLLTGSAFADPSVYATGVTSYDPARAYNCDVLFSAADHKTYLIDMNGKVLQHWDAEGFPAKMLDPALVGGRRGIVGLQLSSIKVDQTSGKAIATTGLVPGQPALFHDKTIGLEDWSGNVIWRWGEQAPGGAARQHHDWVRLANGNTLILANLVHVIPGFGSHPMLDDVIYEIDGNGAIVWTWIASGHLDEFGFTPAELRLVRHASEMDYLHMNDMEVLGPNRWERAGDHRLSADNLLVSSRNANFSIIISRKTGKVVWRLGPNYAPRDEHKPEFTPMPIDQISGQHDGNMIPEGFPGAGDILIFDNQGEGGYPPATLELTGGSRVIEIDPVKRQIVWEYAGRSSGRPDWTFFSPFISSAQRLPNGNTLIDEGVNGRFFQVTPRGDIVWEYVSPFEGAFPAPPVSQHKPIMSNWVYRIQGVPYAWVPSSSQHAGNAVTPPESAAFTIPENR